MSEVLAFKKDGSVVMIFAEGFMFIGKIIIGARFLEDVVRVTAITLQTPQGVLPATTMQKVGQLKIDVSAYPTLALDAHGDNANLYQEYIKLITGLDIPINKITH